MSARPEVRDHAGRFAAGTRGGPGRKPRRDLRAIVEAAGEDVDGELASIGKTLFGLAKNGDVGAAGLVLRHLVTAPAVGIELDVAHDGERDPETDARTLMSILATAAARDDRAAAALACIALRSAPSKQLQELAAGLAARYPDAEEKELPNGTH